ncbi:hypothetical protein vseg_011573 [Gypsophila vaccaria]
MEFQQLKRRQLQGLCKLNNIPANLSNAAMALSLSLLPSVQGLEEFMRDPTATDPGSPDGSVITSPDALRPSTRQKPAKEEQPEGSRLATRTRCGTRGRAVDGTGARKTTATRTTRKAASQEAMLLSQTEKDLQANFEAHMEQSQVADNSGLLGDSKEIADQVSGVSVDSEDQFSLESQANEGSVVISEVQDLSDVDVNRKNLANINAVEEVQEEPSEMFNSIQKVDFHNFSRKDLQSLCKKNKLPANTTNATMADALKSLEIVKGLEEALTLHNSQAPRSPTMSEMTSSCARRTWTSRRVKNEPGSLNLITKSCRGSRRKVTEEFETIALIETPEAVDIVDSIEGSEFPEQLLTKDTLVDVNTHKICSTDVSKDAEDVNSGVEFGSEPKDKQLENGNEGTRTESEVSTHAGSEHDAKNSELENLDKVTNAEELDSGVFRAAELESEPVDLCLIGKHETEQDQLSEKFDFKHAIPAYQPPVSVNNTEIGLVKNSTDSAEDSFPVEQFKTNTAEENTSLNDTALNPHSIEMLEASFTKDEMSRKPDLESTIPTDQYDARGEETPLDNKSLRKLKKLLREKLQATVSLANKMENLTLEENDDRLAKVEEVEDEECDNLELSDVEVDQEMISEKHVSITPSKMMNHVNKENIHHSASATKSAKISDDISGKFVSTMSMGKLKEALQHSEKKRPALHERSENCHLAL